MSFSVVVWWLTELVHLLPALALRFGFAWLLTFIVLNCLFSWLKPRLRTQALHLDAAIRAWSHTWRYRVHHETPTERVLLTWFFRFWTNFASAPSLSVLSVAVPVWHYSQILPPGATPPARLAAFSAHTAWLLPGLCFAGAIPLSYFLKRIFRRLRPHREQGAFGHRMKDHSFPSGHSLTALCFWSMTTISTARAGAAPAVVATWAAWSVIVVLLTGKSRVYLGVHYPSDIAGGYIIGVVWSVLYYLAVSRLL